MAFAYRAVKLEGSDRNSWIVSEKDLCWPALSANRHLRCGHLRKLMATHVFHRGRRGKRPHDLFPPQFRWLLPQVTGNTL
jgi:hypothetical protein